MNIFVQFSSCPESLWKGGDAANAWRDQTSFKEITHETEKDKTIVEIEREKEEKREREGKKERKVERKKEREIERKKERKTERKIKGKKQGR